MPGGYDIHPRRWDEDEALHPTAEPDEARDELEIPLAREAWRLGLPILGICRGEQVLNVALGGSLIQDIPSHCGVDDGPAQPRAPPRRPEEAHQVELAPGSRLARLVGGPAPTVNSRHHQAVLRVAPGLRAVAWYRDPEPGRSWWRRRGPGGPLGGGRAVAPGEPGAHWTRHGPRRPWASSGASPGR